MWLVGTGAIGAIPVAIIDLVAAMYLLQVWWRQRRHARADTLAALPLGLFFACLASLALAQSFMMSCTDLVTSFRLNYIGQSASVVMSAPCLVAFAYGFITPAFPRERRIAFSLVLALSVIIAVGFVVDGCLLGVDNAYFNNAAEHGQAGERPPGWPDVLRWAIPLGVFPGYCISLAVLVRKALAFQGRDRAGALQFAVVVLLAIIGAVVNRASLPLGTYTAYMLWVTLAAFLLFLAHTDEITRFHDRIAAVVLVFALAILAVIAAKTLHTLTDWSLAAGLSYWDARRAVDVVASPFAIAMVGVTVAILALVPRIAEVSVLRPIRKLERADADSRAKSVFLAAMSHELKTPLNAILHHARVLADPQVDKVAKDVEERADTVATSAEHLLALIEALLLAAKNDGAAASLGASFAPEPLELGALIDDIVAMHAPTLEKKGLTLSLDVEALGLVRLDRRMLWQVISNLVGNAVKYTPRGSITVRVRGARERVQISVEDTGPGIPKEAREKIFLPFFRLSPVEGHGLGLAIARQLVEAMGGTISVGDAGETGALLVVDLAAPKVTAPAVVEAQPAVEPIAIEHVALTPPVRAELLALARVGDVVTLRERARDLARAADTAAFAAALDRLAAKCQIRSIRRLLEDGAT